MEWLALTFSAYILDACRAVYPAFITVKLADSKRVSAASQSD